MPIFSPGSLESGGGSAIFYEKSEGSVTAVPAETEVDIIPSTQERGFRSFWIYNPGPDSVILRGESGKNAFPLHKGYMFQSSDAGGPGAGWKAWTESEGCALHVLIKGSSQGESGEILSPIEGINIFGEPPGLPEGNFYFLRSDSNSTLEVALDSQSAFGFTLIETDIIFPDDGAAGGINYGATGQDLHIGEPGNFFFSWNVPDFPYLFGIVLDPEFGDLAYFSIQNTLLTVIGKNILF